MPKISGTLNKRFLYSREKSSRVKIPNFNPQIRNGQEFRHRSLSVALTMTKSSEVSIFSMLGFFLSARGRTVYKGCMDLHEF